MTWLPGTIFRHAHPGLTPIAWTACLAALLVATAGCNRETSPGANPKPVVANAPAGRGVIVGQVKFVGPPPPVAPPIEHPCHEGVMNDEAVLLNSNGTLKNVFVYLQSDVAVDASSAAPAELDQKNCRYVPHGLAVQTGQQVMFKSSDDVPHNIHFEPSDNPAGNFSMVHPGDTHAVTFAHPEFILVKCDVHPWMSAYVGVFSHPWFALTGADGTFRIEHVPPGKYDLLAWQERLGAIKQSIVVNEESPTQVDFEYKPTP